MSYKDYEKYIKKNLSIYDKKIDDSDMWSNIEPHLPRKKKRRYLWPIFLVGILIFMSYGLISNKSPISNQEPLPTSNEIIIEELNTNTDKYISKEPTQHHLAISKLDNLELESVSRILPGEKSKGTLTLEGENKALENNIKHSQGFSRDANHPSVQASNSSSQRSDFSNAEGANPLHVESKVLSTLAVNKNTEELNSTASEHAQKSNKSLLQLPNEHREHTSISLISQLAPLKNSITRLDYNLTLPPLVYESIIKTDIAPDRYHPFKLNVFTGYSTLIQRHRPRSIENENLSLLRNSLENTYESLSLGANIEYGIKRNLSISAGIEVYRYQSGSFTTARNERLRTVLDTIALIQTTTGVITEFGDRIVNSTKTQKWRRITTSTNISVPLIIHYHKDISTHSSISLGVGYRIGFFNQTTGYEQDLNAQEYSLGEDLENRLKSRGQNHGIFSLNWNRKLRQKSELSVGIRYLHDMTGIYNRHFELQKKLHHLGLTLSYGLPIN